MTRPAATPTALRAAPLLRLFVYGTLKRGGLYHERYCTGARSIEPACVRGLVYRLSPGYPVLVVPEGAVLAHGSADAAADARRGRMRISRAMEVVGDWRDVPGELLTFDDPEKRLGRIDKLEGFRPGHASLYRRVLTAVRRETGARLAAWVYVAGELARGSVLKAER